MNCVRTLIVTLALPIVSAATAAAGVVIVETQSDGARTTTLYVEGQRVRVETTADRGMQVFVFDGDADLFYVIDSANKTYRQMSRADLEKMVSQAGDALAQMKDTLDKLPPAQRKRVEEMMARRMGDALGNDAKRLPIEFAKTGATKTVAEWTCNVYEGSSDGVKQVEICTVPLDDLGTTRADFAVFEELARFFSGLMPGRADETYRIAGIGLEGYEGFPVQRIIYANGAPQTTFEVTEIRREPVPAAMFQVPEGFVRQEMPAFGAPPRP